MDNHEELEEIIKEIVHFIFNGPKDAYYNRFIKEPKPMLDSLDLILFLNGIFFGLFVLPFPWNLFALVFISVWFSNKVMPVIKDMLLEKAKETEAQNMFKTVMMSFPENLTNDEIGILKRLRIALEQADFESINHELSLSLKHDNLKNWPLFQWIISNKLSFKLI